MAKVASGGGGRSLFHSVPPLPRLVDVERIATRFGAKIALS
jgi:hypothetical protein